MTAVMTGYGLVVAGASFAASQAILSGRHAGLSITHPGAWRVIVASALLAPVSALAGMALGALIRHSATTMVLTVGALLLLPEFVTDRYHWTACVRNALPFNTWERLVQVNYGHMPYRLVSRYPTTVGGAWTVFAVWAAVAVVVTVAVVDRRDV
ncbi:hypothetical protein AB0M61_07280 [Streptomyces sp. NPDC051642]|uniref:hypothetical protein n=1 Tax=Streptomyces sp. NPDC051642 TaxID=3154646 RepID=UPI00341F7BB1